MRIYSFALAHIQGYMPKRAYIISRDRIHDPIPVEVNQELNKPLDKQLRDYRNEYQRIKLRGERLKPWKDKSVEPNYSNKEDFPFHDAKTLIQTELVKGQSLTMLPGVGNKLADSLEDAGYDCVADLLAKKPEDIPFEEIAGIGPVMAGRIRAVLQANKSNKAAVIPVHLVPAKAQTELFIDYEYLSNLNVDMEAEWPNLCGCEMVFMIGAGWVERGKWRYQQFVAEAENQKAERKMFRQFLAFLEEKGIFSKTRTASLYHWSEAEKSQTKQVIERHGGALKRLADLPWRDLLTDVFYSVPIALPGQWKYGLKEVSAALSAYSEEHSVTWPDGLSSGQAAMVAGWKAYEADKPMETVEIELLTRYLESDCKAVWCILRWLRDSVATTLSRRTQASMGGWYSRLVGEGRAECPQASLAHGWYDIALKRCRSEAASEDCALTT
jgi:predicted RecB family nuclease